MACCHTTAKRRKGTWASRSTSNGSGIALWGNLSGHWVYEENPNEAEMLDAFLKYRRLGIMGHASSGKSTFMVGLGVELFFIYGKRCLVICTSTTKGASAGKFWGEIENAWQTVVDVVGGEDVLPGKLNRSEQAIRYDCKGTRDTTAGIKLVAAELGSDKESASKIQGLKADLLLCLADELDTLHDSLMGTVNSNLASNESDLTRSCFVGSWNPTTRLSIAGRFATPAGGASNWNKIKIDGPFGWETDTGGYVLRFDALRSPNIVALKTIHKGLLSIQGIEQIIERSGGVDTPGYYRDVRAWFCPTGLATAVCNENEILQYGAFEREYGWIEPPNLAAGLDTSNTRMGDKNVLTIGKTGKVKRQLPDGSWRTISVAAVAKVYELKIDVSNPRSPEEQITAKLQSILAAPEWANPQDCAGPLLIGNIAIDVTGGALCLPLITSRIGEPLKINFKSRASERTCPTESRKACDMFANKRAEMWWLRPWIRAGQIRGLPAVVVSQLCAAQFKEEAKVITIEDKEELKKRTNGSPDDADSCVLFIEAAKTRFGLAAEEKAKRTLKPGQRIVVGREFDPNAPGFYKEVEFIVPTIPLAERREQERWMTKADKLKFHRAYGPPPMEQVGELLQLSYGETGLWGENF